MNKNIIYEKEKYRTYSEIEKIDDNFILKTNILSTIKTYSKIIIPLFTIYIIFILLTSKYFLTIYSFTIILLMLIFFFNSYKIEGKNNKVSIKMNAQEIKLDYMQIKSIYLEKRRIRVFFKNFSSYYIVIIYRTLTNNITDIHLPTIFIDCVHINKFLEHFKVKKTNKNYIEKAYRHNVKRKLIKATLFVIFLISIIIVYLVQIY